MNDFPSYGKPKAARMWNRLLVNRGLIFLRESSKTSDWSELGISLVPALQLSFPPLLRSGMVQTQLAVHSRDIHFLILAVCVKVFTY